MANELQFRADHIGLLIAPPESEGNADEQIRELIAMQRAAGVSVATDGELRRHGFAEAVLASDNPILADLEARPMLEAARMDVKISLAAPSALMARTGASADKAVSSISREVAALVAAGVPYVQLNGGAYGPLIDGDSPIDAQLDADAAMLATIGKCEDCRIALRLGRSGPSPIWNPNDERIERLLQLDFDRFNLDFGTQPKGFDVLRIVPDGKMVALGLIDHANVDMQEGDALLDMIDEAAEKKDGDELALSPRGGFNSKSGMTYAGQKMKLQQVADVVVRWWGFAR